MSDAVDKTFIARDEMSGPMDRIANSLDKLVQKSEAADRGLTSMGNGLDESAKKASAASGHYVNLGASVGKMGEHMSGALGHVMSLGGGISFLRDMIVYDVLKKTGDAALGVGQDMVTASLGLEQFTTSMTTLLGSEGAAQKMDAWLVKISSTMPGTLTQFREAAQVLTAAGLAPGTYLQPLENIAITRNVDPVTAARALANAAHGDSGMLREDLKLNTTEMVKFGAAAEGAGIKAETIPAAIAKMGNSEQYIHAASNAMSTVSARLSNVQDRWDMFKTAMGAGVFEPIKGILTDLVGGDGNGGLLTTYGEKLQNLGTVIGVGLGSAIQKAYEWIKSGMKYIVGVFHDSGDNIWATLNNLSGGALNWGATFVLNIASGIIGAIQLFLIPAIDAIGSMLSLFLQGFSPPKEGKLRHMDRWGKTLMQTYIKGMSTADFGELDKATAGIAHHLEGHSPPKGGKLAEVDVWAGDIMTAFLEGFQNADFSIMDNVTSVIEERLKATGLSGVGLARAVLGDKSAIAQAIAEIEKTGSVSAAMLDGLKSSMGGLGSQTLTMVAAQYQMIAATKHLADAKSAMLAIDEKEKALKAGYLTQQVKLEQELLAAQASGNQDRIKQVENAIRVAEIQNQVAQLNVEKDRTGAQAKIDAAQKAADAAQENAQREMSVAHELIQAMNAMAAARKEAADAGKKGAGGGAALPSFGGGGLGDVPDFKDVGKGIDTEGIKKKIKDALTLPPEIAAQFDHLKGQWSDLTTEFKDSKPTFDKIAGSLGVLAGVVTTVAGASSKAGTFMSEHRKETQFMQGAAMNLIKVMWPMSFAIDAARGMVDDLTKAFTFAYDHVDIFRVQVDFLKDALDKLPAVIDLISSALTMGWASAMDEVEKGVGRTMDSIAAGFNNAIDTINNLLDTIRKWTGFDWHINIRVPGWDWGGGSNSNGSGGGSGSGGGGGGGGMPPPKKEAMGGEGIVSSPTLFLAGEAGRPERYKFEPLGGGGFTPDRGPTTIIVNMPINFHGVTDVREIVRLMDRQIINVQNLQFGNRNTNRAIG